jgi:Heterokaryon incompatibility protein (HET)
MAEHGPPGSRALRDLIVTDEGHLLNRYKYPPLPAKSIRILALTPGQRGTDLHGKIVMNDPDEVNYGALSYVWGDSHLTKSIHIGEATLPITESLYSALQQVRETDEEHWIWCDQICIYSYRTATKCCRNLRSKPQFCEGFGFALHCLDSNLLFGSLWGLGCSCQLHPRTRFS